VLCADLPFNETRHNYAERVVGTARRLVLPLIKKNCMLSARLAWSRLAVHVVQLLNWAFQEVKPEMLPLYVGLAWDLTPLLSSSCSSHTLQGESVPVTCSRCLGCGPLRDCCSFEGGKKQRCEEAEIWTCLGRVPSDQHATVAAVYFMQASARWCLSALSSWMPTGRLPR
jgi:hypothetical protein